MKRVKLLLIHHSSFLIHHSSSSSPRRERRAGSAAALGDYLGEYRERDLLGRDRADVQADGRADLSQKLFVEAGLAQAREHDVRAATAPYHAHVVGARPEHGPHALLVLVVPARDHRDVDAAPRAYRLPQRPGPPGARGDQLDLLFGEARARDELLAVVYERDAVADRRGQARERRADVARAADHHARLGLDPLEHHARAAPRRERGRELLDAKRPRLRARREEGARLLGQRLVERRVAGRAGAPAPGLHEELRADARRGLDDRGERGRLAFRQKARDSPRYLCGQISVAGAAHHERPARPASAPFVAPALRESLTRPTAASARLTSHTGPTIR